MHDRNVLRWKITPLSKERYALGPLGMKGIHLFCIQCMVKLHRVGYRNTGMSKGNLPVNEIAKDVMNQDRFMATSSDMYISSKVLYHE